MKVQFLGTGTSTGVPQIGCNCAACRSLDPNDKRLRASAIVEIDGSGLLIDAGPDLRTQLLAAGSPDLDALLVTHHHYDHIGGLIDLRSYCFAKQFPVFCQEDAAAALRANFPYCFEKDLYPGVPTFDIHIIKPFQEFEFRGIKIMPLPVMHYKLEIVGFKIGDFAYITDCKHMPQETIKALKGVKTLVLNALRIEPHMSHLSLSESLEIIEKVCPERTYLTHMSHDMGPEATVSLPEGVKFAHDMLTIQA